MTRPLLEPRPLALDEDNVNQWATKEVEDGKEERWVGGKGRMKGWVVDRVVNKIAKVSLSAGERQLCNLVAGRLHIFGYINHPRRGSVTTSMVGLRNGHVRIHLTKMVNPRDIAG